MHLNKKGFDLKGKRKELPEKIRRKLEESRKEAIEAYKQMKLNDKLKQRENAQYFINFIFYKLNYKNKNIF